MKPRLHSLSPSQDAKAAPRPVTGVRRARGRTQHQQEQQQNEHHRTSSHRLWGGHARMYPAGRKAPEGLHHELALALLQLVPKPPVVAPRANAGDDGNAPISVCTRCRLGLGHEPPADARVLRVGADLVGRGDELPVDVHLPHQRGANQLGEGLLQVH
eukprot:scaffold8128_cov112-Isochrysis_galbana.AAC.3